MRLSDFEDKINPIIVDRGISYYERGLVKEVSQKGDEFIVVVEGTDAYQVFVELDNKGTILFSDCDCPYDKGPICKHQVAAFYEIKKRCTILDEAPSLEELLQSLSKEQLIEIIKDRVNADDTYDSKLTMKYAPEEEADSSFEFIEETIYQYMGDDGFVSYYEVSDLVEELSMVLERAKNLANPIKSLDISLRLLEESAVLIENSDDSSGELGFLIDETLEFINLLARNHKIDTETRTKIFHKIINITNGESLKGWMDYRIALLVVCLEFKNIETAKKHLLNNIEELLESLDNSSFVQDELLKIKLDLLPESKILTFSKKNLKYTSMREILIKRYMKEEKYQELIQLTEEGEKKDQNYPGLVKKWQDERYKAFKVLGLVEKQKDLAQKLLFEGDFSYYLELKQLGEIDYNYLIEKTKKQNHGWGNNIYLKIILHENDLPELLNYVQTKNFEIRNYADLLVTAYPEDVAKIYYQYILSIAAAADNRKKYRSVCNVIQDYRKYTERGKIQQLITELKALYNRKPAFLDELSKV